MPIPSTDVCYKTKGFKPIAVITRSQLSSVTTFYWGRTEPYFDNYDMPSVDEQMQVLAKKAAELGGDAIAINGGAFPVNIYTPPNRIDYSQNGLNTSTFHYKDTSVVVFRKLSPSEGLLTNEECATILINAR